MASSQQAAGARSASVRATAPKRRERLTADDRRAEILAAVRDLAAEQGVNALSISEITRRAGCTRSLFYHYFPDKEAALDAALETVIDGFIDRLRNWNASRVQGDIEGSLDSAVSLLRACVLRQNDLPRAIMAGGDAALYANFTDRVADRVASYIVQSTVVDFARFHSIHIRHVYETFYVLICGLIMFVRTHPDASDNVIKDLIAQSLRIEEYTRTYAGHWLAEE